MSDRRFIVVLISAGTALLGVGVVVLAILGLQDPLYRDFDTGVVRDTSRTLIGLVTLGGVLILAGVAAVVTLLRLQLRSPR